MATHKKFSFLAAAAVASVLSNAAAWATVCGDAYFNRDINWPSSSALYYTVAGAPANTCGDLWTNRNGAGFSDESPGWICTDGAGTATKGPWYSNSHDETAYVYIDWGTCTSPTREHIWDVTAPTVAITYVDPSHHFNGTATDATWGAGFSSAWYSSCLVTYYDSTDQLYWVSTSQLYAQDTPWDIGTTITGMPSMSISWSANDVASVQSGHCYVWKAQCWDGGQWGYASTSFCE